MEVTFFISLNHFLSNAIFLIRFNFKEKEKVEHGRLKILPSCQIFAAAIFHQKKRRKSLFPDLAVRAIGGLSGRWSRREPAGFSGCWGFEARPRPRMDEIWQKQKSSFANKWMIFLMTPRLGHEPWTSWFSFVFCQQLHLRLLGNGVSRPRISP